MLASSKYINQRIVLIEAGTLGNPDSRRVSSLRPSSVNLLQQLQVWDKIRFCRVKGMKVWDNLGAISFNSNDYISSIVYNSDVQLAILDKLKQLDNVTILGSTKVDQIYQTEHGLQLGLSNNEEMTCDLVVGADGPNSKIRQYAKIETDGFDYNQMGLIARLSVEDHENETVTSFEM